ncbi:MAG: DUF1983 domain-containing protein [Ectothiorhodospiraceae bacterium]|nr:DUF1983 domain-containing protein [Ectothiorhodospiraceae bacterium]
MSSKTRSLQLPSIPTDASPALRHFLEGIKQAVEIGEGLRGDALDAKLTRRDLVEIGLANVKQGGGGIRAGSASSVLESGQSLPNLTTPPPVVNFDARGAFSRVIMTWGQPGYANHSHVEIWRSQTRDIGRAALIGTQAARIHVDVVGGSFSGYYWARNVSASGVRGPFAGPRLAETADDARYFLEQLTGDIVESPLFKELSESIVGELPEQWTVKVGTTVDGQPVVGGIGLAANPPGSDAEGTVDFGVLADRIWFAAPGVDYSQEDRVFPFIVSDGRVYIQNTLIEEGTITYAQLGEAAIDELVTESLDAVEAYIGTLDVWDVTVGNMIQSEGYSPSGSGFRVEQGGAARFAGNNFEIDTPQLQVGGGNASFSGALNAATGTFAGSLSAATGTFSGSLTASAVDAVDTINLRGNAVTVPVASVTSGEASWGGGWTVVQSATISGVAGVQVACNISMEVRATLQTESGSGGSASWRVRRGSTTLQSGSIEMNQPYKYLAGSFLHTGNATYTLEISGSYDPGSSGAVLARHRNIQLLGVKR